MHLAAYWASSYQHKTLVGKVLLFLIGCVTRTSQSCFCKTVTLKNTFNSNQHFEPLCNHLVRVGRVCWPMSRSKLIIYVNYSSGRLPARSSSADTNRPGRSQNMTCDSHFRFPGPRGLSWDQGLSVLSACCPDWRGGGGGLDRRWTGAIRDWVRRRKVAELRSPILSINLLCHHRI